MTLDGFRKRVVTDRPRLTGEFDGYRDKPKRRKPSKDSQDKEYEKGFRRGIKRYIRDTTEDEDS